MRKSELDKRLKQKRKEEMLNYKKLSKYPKVFLQITGLKLEYFNEVCKKILLLYKKRERQKKAIVGKKHHSYKTEIVITSFVFGIIKKFTYPIIIKEQKQYPRHCEPTAVGLAIHPPAPVIANSQSECGNLWITTVAIAPS